MNVLREALKEIYELTDSWMRISDECPDEFSQIQGIAHEALESSKDDDDKNYIKVDVEKVISTLEEIDKNTDLLDISEDIAPQFHPSHSWVALQIRKLVRSLLEQFKKELSDDMQTGT